MRAGRGQKVLFGGLFVLVLCVSAAPIFRLLVRLTTHGEYFSLLFLPENLSALYATLRICVLSLATALCFALPISWFLVRSDLAGAGFLRRLFMFPYMLPPYLFAIAWMTLGVPRIGFLNRWAGVDWLNIYSTGGLVWVFATAYMPIRVSSLCSAMESMDPSLEESARISGDSPLRTVLQITFPCLLPTIVSSSLLYTLAIMAAFGIPALIGDPGRIYLLTTKIYTYVKLGGLKGTDQAITLALWLFCFSIMFILLNEWVRRKYLSRLVVGKAVRHTRVRLGRLRFPFFLLIAFCGFILVILPISAIFLNSFLKVGGDLRWSNFTLNNYTYLFQMRDFLPAFKNSVFLSVTAGFVCVVVAFFVAYFSDRTNLRLRGVLENLATFPFAVPGAVIALALIISYGSGWGFREFALLGSPMLLLLAYVSKYMALSVQNLTAAISQIHPSLDEAARVSGAKPGRVLKDILVPLLFPVLINVYVLTALPVFSELTMSVLLMGPGLETVGTVIFQLQEYAQPLAACSMASLLVVFLVIVMNTMRFVSHRLGERS